jgi:hypothetical protein
LLSTVDLENGGAIVFLRKDFEKGVMIMYQTLFVVAVFGTSVLSIAAEAGAQTNADSAAVIKVVAQEVRASLVPGTIQLDRSLSCAPGKCFRNLAMPANVSAANDSTVRALANTLGASIDSTSIPAGCDVYSPCSLKGAKHRVLFSATAFDLDSARVRVVVYTHYPLSRHHLVASRTELYVLGRVGGKWAVVRKELQRIT